MKIFRQRRFVQLVKKLSFFKSLLKNRSFIKKTIFFIKIFRHRSRKLCLFVHKNDTYFYPRLNTFNTFNTCNTFNTFEHQNITFEKYEHVI